MSEPCRPLTRRAFVQVAGASALAGAAGAPTAADGSVQVRGVGPYRVYDPLFECVRVVLASRGERLPTGYVQGIAGSGFRIGGPCPCAPTCTHAMLIKDLIALFGYEAEPIEFDNEARDHAARLAEVLARIKAEVRAGRPVIVFHAFTSAEWDVVSGYDDATRRLIGRGGYGSMMGRQPVRADEGRMVTCTDICPIGGALLVGRKTGRLDARHPEVAALREGARHARDTSRKDYPFNGLAVYDRWLVEWSKPGAQAEWGRDGYTTAVYSSTHAAGAAFLRHLSRRYARAASHLDEAALYLEREAAGLHRILALLFPGEGKPQPTADDARSRVPPLLASARADYAAFADRLDEAVAAIDT